jgi:hypothetical protein
LVQNNFTNIVNWTSGNEKIDDLIQEMHLNIEDFDDGIVFEWIPYNQFIEIKETGKNNSVIIYSAIWKDGPLCYNHNYNYTTRDSNKKVALKCLQNSQNNVEFLIDEV